MELSPLHVTTSNLTIVIVMVILIIVAFTVFSIVLVLYRQGRIFKPQQSSEVEMDKRSLTQLSRNETQPLPTEEENQILTNVANDNETSHYTEEYSLS